MHGFCFCPVRPIQSGIQLQLDAVSGCRSTSSRRGCKILLRPDSRIPVPQPPGILLFISFRAVSRYRLDRADEAHTSFGRLRKLMQQDR